MDDELVNDKDMIIHYQAVISQMYQQRAEFQKKIRELERRLAVKEWEPQPEPEVVAAEVFDPVSVNTKSHERCSAYDHECVSFPCPDCDLNDGTHDVRQG